MELSTESKKSLAAWFGSGDTGASSETLAIAALTGFPPGRASFPLDPSDFGRCARLIERVPEVREAAFTVLKDHGSVWPRLICEWDNIESLMEEECGIDWKKSRVAERTYDELKRIIHAS